MRTYLDIGEDDLLLGHRKPREDSVNFKFDGAAKALSFLMLKFLFIVIVTVLVIAKIYPRDGSPLVYPDTKNWEKTSISFSLEQCPRDLTFYDSSNPRVDCCADPTFPVVGGIDVVELFSQPEDSMPNIGSPLFQYKLQTSTGVYTFRFISEENRRKFFEDPWKYAPAYGGFCACGIALEERFEDPDFKSKLGPYVDLSKWDILNGRLFFFSGPTPCNYFKSEMITGSVERGDTHWAAFYDGNLHDGVFNTNCFHRQAFEDMVNGVQTEFVCPDTIKATCGC